MAEDDLNEDLFQQIRDAWLRELDLSEAYHNLTYLQQPGLMTFSRLVAQRLGLPYEGPALHQAITERFETYLEQHAIVLPADQHEQLRLRLLSEFIGWGPLDFWMADNSIQEIMINGPHQVFVWRRQKDRIVSPFEHDDDVLRIIHELAASRELRVDEHEPISSFGLNDGSFASVVLRPISLVGPCLYIRKFRKTRLEIQDLLRFGALTPDMAELLTGLVVARLNIIISGNMGSGMFTLMNVLGTLIPAYERVITIEEFPVLDIPVEHLIPLESRPPNKDGQGAVTVRDLIEVAARLSPERIIVADLDGPEVFDLLRVVQRNYRIMALIQAETAEEALERVEMKVKFFNPDLPVPYLRMLTSSSIDIIVQQYRMPDGSRKVAQIAEVLPLEDGRYRLNYIYRFQQTGTDERGKIIGQFVSQPLSPRLAQHMASRAIQLPPELLPPV